MSIILESLTVSVLYRYILPVGVVYILFYVLGKNYLTKFKISKLKITTNQLRNEFFWSILSRILFVLISIAIIFLRDLNLVHFYTSTNLIFDKFYSALTLVILFLFHDAYFYWTHRWLHTNKFLLSKVHSVHHQSLNPTPLAANSFHPIEALLNGFYLIIFVLLVPVHPVVILIESLASVFLGVYAHLGYEFIPLKVRSNMIFKYIMTPTNHNTHHRIFKKNFGFYFLFWDRVCGTIDEVV